jgi:hypothetical protein
MKEGSLSTHPMAEEEAEKYPSIYLFIYPFILLY